MTEASDNLGFVQVACSRFHSPNDLHLSVVCKAIFPGQHSLLRWTTVQSMYWAILERQQYYIIIIRTIIIL